MNERTKTILDFWFIQTSQEEKFGNNKTFDKKIRDNFLDDYQKAIKNEYDYWLDNASECLALIILLDQFSRNLFRNNPEAFAMDNKARLVANHTIDKGYCEKLTNDQLIFIFLPFMHSEELKDTNLYFNNFEELTNITKEMSNLENQQLQKENRWLELKKMEETANNSK
jgi:uncharacterized protein (DUF924 family)